jgi:hypothetical protein
MPNGTIIKNVPKGITQDQLLSKLGTSGLDTKLLLQPLKEDTGKENAGFFGSLFEGAQTSGLADEAAAYAANPTEANRRALIKAGESQYRQVGFGEGENWEAFKQLAGGSLGQLAAPVAAGLAGSLATPVAGLAAASAVSGAQYTSQNLLRQAQEQEAAIAAGKKPEDTSVGKAILAATGQTALDLAGGRVFTGIAKAFPFMRPLLGQAGGRAAQEAGEVLADATANGTIKFAKGIATGVGKGVAFEVPQEIAQQGLERWQAGKSLFDEEAQSEYGQAAIGALLLGGSIGGVSGAISSRNKEAAPEEEIEPEAPEPDIIPTTPVEREGVFSRLASAAGDDLSTGATAAIRALERRVSNDLSTNTPESLAETQKYIVSQEDQIAAGQFPEDMADPLVKALGEAKRMVEEAAPAAPVEAAPIEEAAPVTPVEEAAPIEAAPAAEGFTRVYHSGAAGEGETGRWVSTDKQYASDYRPDFPLFYTDIPSSDPRVNNPDYEDQGVGQGFTFNFELSPEEATTLKPIERVQRQETPDAGVGRDTAPIGDGIGASVPPSSQQGLTGDITGGVERPNVEPVGGYSAPPIPPSVSPDAQPDTLARTEEIPAPTRAGQVSELKPAPNWVVNLVDKFGMSAPLDAWTKSTLGYEVLPEQLGTESKLKMAASKQAGQERILQRDYFNPIVEAAGKLKVDMGDLGMYLWARGAADRNRIVAEQNVDFPEGGSGLTTAQAAETMQKFKDEGLLPKLNQLARKADAVVDFTLKEKVKAGLMTTEEATQLRKTQPYYMPLKGFASNGDMLTADIGEDAHSPDRRAEAARALRTAVPTGSINEYRKAFGRGSMPFHPLFNLFQDAEQSVRRNITNEAIKPVLKTFQANPSAFEGIMNVYTDANPKKVMMGRDIPGGRFEPVDMKQEYYGNQGKYYLVKDDGVAHYIEFADTGVGADLNRMFANMNPKDMEGAMQQLANVNNFLKGMLTYKNPLYLAFVAPFRDVSDAVATAMLRQNTKGDAAFGKNLAAKTFFYAINPTTWSTIGRFVFGKGAMNDTTGMLLKDMLRDGGTPLQTRFLNTQEKADAANKAIKQLRGLDGMDPKARAGNLLTGLNTWVDGLADIMDMAARFATYRAATDLGINGTAAADLALDSSLNLTRRGEMARGIDLVIPFFGASVEGSRKTLRIMSNPRTAVKIIGGLIAYGAMESVWNAMQSGDSDDDGQEDYLDLDQGASLRMSRVTLFYGSGPDDYIKVPIGQMLGYFKFFGNKIGDVMAGASTTGEATKGLVPGFFSLMSPMRIPSGDLPSFAGAITPLVGKPFVGVGFNQNFFGSPIYTESFPGGAPKSELGRPSTAEPWKEVAKAVNYATGGSEAVSGAVDFQPEVYRYFIESYFGGPYQLAKQMVGLKDAEEIADVPGIKSFVGTGAEYAAQTKYFANTDTTRQIMNRLSKLTPEQQMAQGERYFVDTDPRVLDAYKAVEANLDRIGKQQKETLKEEMSAKDKQMVLDYYRAEKNQYYSAFNAVYNAVKKGE